MRRVPGRRTRLLLFQPPAALMLRTAAWSARRDGEALSQRREVRSVNLMAHFPKAHWRHWEDAELLYAHERWGNADHLFGFSAECGLKAVMAKNGMPLDAFGHPRESSHRKHIQDLWEVFERFSGDLASGSLEELPSGSPFSDWSHHDRYSATGYARLAAVDRHREAARRILRLVRLVGEDTTQ